jgi:hypothetical protein
MVLVPIPAIELDRRALAGREAVGDRLALGLDLFQRVERTGRLAVPFAAEPGGAGQRVGEKPGAARRPRATASVITAS